MGSDCPTTVCAHVMHSVGLFNSSARHLALVLCRLTFTPRIHSSCTRLQFAAGQIKLSGESVNSQTLGLSRQANNRQTFGHWTAASHICLSWEPEVRKSLVFLNARKFHEEHLNNSVNSCQVGPIWLGLTAAGQIPLDVRWQML